MPVSAESRSRSTLYVGLALLLAVLMIVVPSKVMAADGPLDDSSRSISGKIILPTGASPESLRGVTVTANPTAGDAEHVSVAVDPTTGAFTIDGLKRTEYTLSARASRQAPDGTWIKQDLVGWTYYYGSGYASSGALVFDLWRTSLQDLDMPLELGHAISGTVILPVGASADWWQYVQVNADLIAGGEIQPSVEVDPQNGTYTIRRLPAGTYLVTAYASGEPTGQLETKQPYYYGCSYGCKWTEAKPLELTVGNIEKVDLALARKGEPVPVAPRHDVVVIPTPEPAPTDPPSATPSATPSVEPSSLPSASAEPTAAPSASAAPSATPTAVPSVEPTTAPTTPAPAVPSATPSTAPSVEPTAVPSASAAPSATPTAVPSVEPTTAPTTPAPAVPSATPSAAPTAEPTAAPAPAPQEQPTPQKPGGSSNGQAPGMPDEPQVDVPAPGLEPSAAPTPLKPRATDAPHKQSGDQPQAGHSTPTATASAAPEPQVVAPANDSKPPAKKGGVIAAMSQTGVSLSYLLVGAGLLGAGLTLHLLRRRRA
ncbi:Ribonucleases G and E [Actinomyces bovis]|uniref:Ribonucleases G and E n=1 Tax=Actinomyces bovis TaxID=1658 RepID=A0ABY1VMN1_9ACTO|nr:hypothetical protein [Actinomyces bovis]SPT53199.1 Ribonucleases G and E [Actinomyces bovis]VEG52419.1 Ribonucleases G and E [Actinomyces israelii]